MASLIEERLLDDPVLTQVAIHAFNQWLYDDWTYDYEGRLFATPIVNPCLLDEGIAELELALERGAKAVLMRPAPVSSLRGPRSPFLPEFDPFWARIEESGVLVALHASDSGYQDYLNTWEGTDGEYVAFRPQDVRVRGRRRAVDPGCDRLRDLPRDAHEVPGREDHQRRERRELGRHAAHHLEATYKKMPQEFPEHPIEVFRRNVWINPFWEDSVTGLIDLIGADRVCFGSDYPHPEGLENPLEWADELTGTSAADVERIMSSNMFELMGVDKPVTVR